MIEVVCVCKRRFEVQSEHAGLSIKCPECRRLVAVPGTPSSPIPDTIPPPGLQLPFDPAATVPPSALAASAAPAAPAATPAPRDEYLLGSLESLIRLCETIRVLLACILAALLLLLIQGFFRR
jgi:hypothetical protein